MGQRMFGVSDGVLVGTVKGLINQSDNAVTALLLDEGGLTDGARAVLVGAVTEVQPGPLGGQGQRDPIASRPG